MDGWMDGWMDGCVYICVYLSIYLSVYLSIYAIILRCRGETSQLSPFCSEAKAAPPTCQRNDLNGRDDNFRV